MTQAAADVIAPDGALPVTQALSQIQRAYLVGDQGGLELRGPARYYVGCDLDPARVAGAGERLRRLVRANVLLRVGVGADLSLSALPVDVASEVDADVRRVADADFDAANAVVRADLTSDALDFDAWPQFAVVVVESEHRARLHLVYALWLMDASVLEVFLAELVGGREDEAVAATELRAAPRVRPRRAARDERFWRERAAALADPAELPLRPAWRQSGRAVSHRMLTIDAPAAQRIERRAREHGLTPALAYLAAYGFTLGRLGGGGAHTVTVLYAPRAQPVTHDALGNSGNSMPLEVPATSEHSFVELARALQARYLSQAMHGSLSGAEIARLGDPGTDPRRLPYPFAFTALEVDSQREARHGFRRRWDEVQLRVPQVLIDHQAVMDADGSARLGFDWRTDAFDHGFGGDLVAQHAALVAELAGDPKRWTRRPAPAVARGSVDRRPATAEDTLQDRVLRTAVAMPDVPAVHDADGTLTYAELVDRAHEVARLLLAAGVAPGDRVAMHLPRGGGQVVAILGILLAGGVYVPLAHGTPDGRLDSIARCGDVRHALTAGDGGADNRWRARGATPVTLPAQARATRRPLPHVRRVPTAYVMFTSGSTGEPKGVVISHAAALTTIDAVNDLLDLRDCDRILSVSSIGFDLSVYDVFGPLLRGASVVMLSEETARSPAAWVRLIRRHGVTVWNSAPPLASLLAEEQAPLAPVRVFMLSGDWIPLTLPGALARLAPSAEAISLGGATEGAIWSIYHRVREEDCTGRSIPYGRPLAGQDILVLDAERRMCAAWEIGEIHIAGSGVADGYLNDSQKREAAFCDDPAFGWIYRTGDRGRSHPDGIVEFLGRTDTQVKLNGHRVELGEIEHVLERSPAVRSCAACVRGRGRRRGVVAFVHLAPDAAPDWRDDLSDALEEALPQYMVPDAIVEIDEIPLTSNGKLDRRPLEALALDEGPATDAPVLQTQDRESHEVAICWQEVLGEAPGEGTFFEAGGGSYDAIRLLSLLHSRFGRDVAFGDFMGAPTLGGLAALCRRTGGGENTGIWTSRPRPRAAPRVRLVLFPPVGGGVSCYTSLTLGLSEDVDVHVVAFDRAVEGLPEGPPALTDLAHRCLEHLPEDVRAGDAPLVFAGWSFGGALAFEAARLSAAPVARVVVVDTPVSTASRGGCDERAEASVDKFARDIRETGGVAVEAAQVAEDPMLRSRFEVYRQNMRLLRDWAPEQVDVSLVELRAADDPAERDPGAWCAVARVEQVAVLPGGHFDVFESENMRRLAGAIEEVSG